MFSYLLDLKLWNMNYNHKLKGNVKNFHKNTVMKYFFLPKTKKGSYFIITAVIYIVILSDIFFTLNFTITLEIQYPKNET